MFAVSAHRGTSLEGAGRAGEGWGREQGVRGAAALRAGRKRSGQCHSCCHSNCGWMTTAATQLETEEKLPWVGALWEPKGRAKHPSNGTVCGREGRLPGPARPLLPEGSEVPECLALTSFESLTFIFKGPSQRTQCDSSLPEGSGVTTNVSKLHSRSEPSSLAPFTCHSGSPRRESFSEDLGLKAETPQGHKGPCTSSVCCLLGTPRSRKKGAEPLPLQLCLGIYRS